MRWRVVHILAILMVCLMVAVSVLVGCSGKNNLADTTWKLQDTETTDGAVEASVRLAVLDGQHMTIVFDKEQAKILSNGVEQAVLAYEQNGKSVTLENGIASISGTVSGDTLTLEEGDTTYTFGKE